MLPPAPDGRQVCRPGLDSHFQRHALPHGVSDQPHRALEVEALASERFAAVGETVLAALAGSGLSARRTANVISWFIVAQLALGPWHSRGEVRPKLLAKRLGVSRWSEWRTRRDALRAGVVRDWTLPEDEARGYGRGAVRVLELAFVRTRAVTQRVAAAKDERASRAERRRAERERLRRERAVQAGSPSKTPSAAQRGDAAQVTQGQLTAAELVSPVAGQLWGLIERAQARIAARDSSPSRSRPP
jgi:hypothetical protein